MKIIAAILGIILFSGLILAIPLAIIFGLHIQTGAGDHTGYITSVERNGLFFKTGRAYVKTSTQSTQEDAYCVTDPQVYDTLQAASVSGVHVNVKYHSWFASGVIVCDGEDAIIDSVQTLSQ